MDKMFKDYEKYKEMLEKKGFSKAFLDCHASFIRASFDLDVNIIDLDNDLQQREVANYIIDHKIDVLDDNGFIDSSYIAERFDMSADEARKVARILIKRDAV